MTDLESIVNEPIELPVNGTTVKASRLSMEDLGRIGSKWRQERIDNARSAQSMRMVSLDGHMQLVAAIARVSIDPVAILTDYDLQRIALQVACSKHDKKFDAGKLCAGDAYAAVDALLVESRLMKRQEPGEDSKTDPFGSANQSTGQTLPDGSHDTTASIPSGS